MNSPEFGSPQTGPHCLVMDLIQEQENDLVGIQSRVIRLEDALMAFHQSIIFELQKLNSKLEPMNHD